MFVQNTNFAFASFYIHYSNELHRLLTQRIDTPRVLRCHLKVIKLVINHQLRKVVMRSTNITIGDITKTFLWTLKTVPGGKIEELIE